MICNITISVLCLMRFRFLSVLETNADELCTQCRNGRNAEVKIKRHNIAKLLKTKVLELDNDDKII